MKVPKVTVTKHGPRAYRVCWQGSKGFHTTSWTRRCDAEGFAKGVRRSLREAARAKDGA